MGPSDPLLVSGRERPGHCENSGQVRERYSHESAIDVVIDILGRVVCCCFSVDRELDGNCCRLC